MDTVDKKIQQSEVSIQRLKDQGVDVSALEAELDQVKAGYDSAYGKVDSDEAAVNSYVGVPRWGNLHADQGVCTGT